MTQGTPWKKIAVFALPLLIGNLFQQLYNAVDSVVVGRYIGDSALAAVGASMPVFMMLVGFFMGVSIGATTLIAQYYGAGDMAGVRRAMHTTLTLTLIASVICTVLGLAITDPLLRLMRVPDDIFESSRSYLVTLFAGISAMMFYNMIGGMLRGIGDSLTPLYFLIGACVLNVALDILFVAVIPMGVMGVAFATVIAQALSAIACIFVIHKRDSGFLPRPGNFHFDPKLLKKILLVGVPSGFQQVALSVGNIMLQTMINGFGTQTVAAANMIMRVDGFIIMPMFALANAITAYVGQNMGAQRPDRVRKGVASCAVMLTALCAFIGVTLIFATRPLMHLFTSTSEVVAISSGALFILLPFYVVLGMQFMLTSAMRGAGVSMVPLVITFVAMFGVRVPLAYVLGSRANDFMGIWRATVIGWFFGSAVSFAYFMLGNWHKKKLIETDTPALPDPIEST